MILFSKKGWRYWLWRRKLPCLRLILAMICLGLLGSSVAAAKDIFGVTKEGRITANIADLPLGQALAALSRSVPLEIRGSVVEDERLTLRFSRLTLREALQEMLAGYNYVLIRPEAQGKPVLVILGKTAKGTAAVSPPAAGLPPSQPPQSATLQPSPLATPISSYGPAPPSYDETVPAPSSPAPAPAPPLSMVPPLPAEPAGESQAVTMQENLPPDSRVEGPPGAAPNLDSEPPFNPAAWGGRGFRGSAASSRK
jgi:hypothetical protein